MPPRRRTPADWSDRWRTFHKPARAGPFWVGPGWEGAPGDAIAIVIDPGLAFGTGAHPTTRLCLELRRPARGALLDVGCGSGVPLGRRAQARLLAVHAVDDDPLAVETTPNQRRAERRRRGRASRRRRVGRAPAADAVVANIALDVVESIAARVRASELVTSGYLTGERPEPRGWERREPGARRLGCGPLPPPVIRTILHVPTFDVRFLGCKISHIDAQAVRERLVADGHRELASGAEIAVVNTCCVTNEAVAKSRKEVARAARAPPRLRHRLRREPTDAFANVASNVVVVARRSEETPAFVAA